MYTFSSEARKSRCALIEFLLNPPAPKWATRTVALWRVKGAEEVELSTEIVEKNALLDTVRVKRAIHTYSPDVDFYTTEGVTLGTVHIQHYAKAKAEADSSPYYDAKGGEYDFHSDMFS